MKLHPAPIIPVGYDQRATLRALAFDRVNVQWFVQEPGGAPWLVPRSWRPRFASAPGAVL